MADELDKALTEKEKLDLLQDMVATAKKKGGIQSDLHNTLYDIVYKREYPDGTPVKRESVIVTAMKLLHSMVPDKVLEQATVGLDQGREELRIKLVLDAGREDPRVSPAMIDGMFTAGEIPAPEEE